MNLYGKTPTQQELDHTAAEPSRTDVPPEDGVIGGQKYWSCTRAGITYKVGWGGNPFGNYFSILRSVENQMMEYAMQHLTPEGTTVIDAGAACGSWTLPFLCKGHPVYSFELDPKSFHEMMNHIRLNSDLIKKECINCYNIGLYSDNIVGDYYNMKNLRFRKLDDVLPDLNNVSLIKVDVEGAELNVLQGAAQLLQRNEPTMWIECHEIFKPGINQEVLNYVKELGFKGKTVREFEMVPGTKHFLIADEPNI